MVYFLMYSPVNSREDIALAGVFPIVPLFETTGKMIMKFCGTIGNMFVGQLGSLNVGQLGTVFIMINLFL